MTTTTHTVLIDSRDRDFEAYPNPSEYRIMLPIAYKNVEKARLISAEIPASFYVFGADMGNTSMDVTMHATNTTHTITIPDGNYCSSTLCKKLAAALTEATAVDWCVSIDKVTLRLILHTADGQEFTLEPSTGHPTGWGLPFYLGFERDTSYPSTDGELISPRLVSLNPHNYILLDIEELNGLNEGALYGDRVGGASFAKIPFDASSFEYVYLDVAKTRFPEITLRPGLSRVDRLHIKFRFHDGRPVDFRGVEHSMAIEITTRDPSSERRPYNKDTSMTQAASTAAAAAAAAAVTATRGFEGTTRGFEGTKPQAPNVVKTKHSKYRTHVVLGVLCLLVGMWYMWKKRSQNPSA